MKFRVESHRDALLLAEYDAELSSLWDEIIEVIGAISDDEIIIRFDEGAREAKSISTAINELLKSRFVEKGWSQESPIFADSTYREGHRKGTWRLDFAKGDISIEVAFNHRSDIAWNLIKPTLAGELNHVEKAIQTRIGVVITATEAMKAAGGFDSAIGTFEDYVQYLKPLRAQLTTPTVLIGLEAPETFRVVVVQGGVRRKIGQIERHEDSLLR